MYTHTQKTYLNIYTHVYIYIGLTWLRPASAAFRAESMSAVASFVPFFAVK